MTKVSLILGHPEQESFNHAIAQKSLEVLGKHQIEINYHDLYEEDFPPCLPRTEIQRNAVLPPLIQQHCNEIAQADGIIIIHPNWWGQPPAILKGWVDRVIRPGIAYVFIEGDKGEGIPRGLLKAKAALLLNTSNTETKREQEEFKDPLETLWKNCIFGLCGVHQVDRKMFNIIVTSTLEERKKWLDQVETHINKLLKNIQ